MILVNSTNGTITVVTTTGSFPVPPKSSVTASGSLTGPLPAGITVKTSPDADAVHSIVNVLKSVVILSADDLAALADTCVEVVPAPGASKINYVLSMVFESVYDTHAFDAGGNIRAYVGPVDGYDDTTCSLTTQDGIGNAILLQRANALDSPQLSTWAGQGFNDQDAEVSYKASADLANQPVCIFADDNFTKTKGAINASALGSGGTGYSSGDTGTVTGNNGTGATYTVTGVNTGAVTTYTLSAHGHEYSTGSGASTATGGSQPGSGTGFTIDISTVTLDTPDSQLRVTTFYVPVDVA